jgi:hypothetical protein
MILTITEVFEEEYGWPIFAVGIVVFLIVVVVTQRKKHLLIQDIHVKSTNLLGTLDSGQEMSLKNNNNYISDLENMKCDIISGTSSEKV